MRYRQLISVMLLVFYLAGCATVQTREATSGADSTSPARPALPLDEINPSDFTLGSDEADVIYDVLLAEMALQREQPRIAVTYYLDAARRSQNPEIAARATRVASFAQAENEALEAAQIWGRLEPDSIDARRVLTVLYIRHKNYPRAKQELIAYLDASESEDIDKVFMQIGIMLQREADREITQDIAETLAGRYPQVAQAAYLASAASLRNGEFDAALSWADKALELKTDWSDAVVLRAKALKGLGREEELRTYLRDYVEAYPQQDNVRLAYARVLVDQRQLKEARDQFELLVVKMPNDKDVLFALAMLSMQFNQADEAAGYLKQLTRLGRRTPQITYYLGQIAEQQKKYDEAIKWYSSIPQSEYYLEAQLRIAASLSLSKSLEEALQYLDGVPAADKKERKEIALFKGVLLRDNKHYQTAYEHYQQQLLDYPNDFDLMYGRALVSERLNRIDETLNTLDYLISQVPENAAYLNAMGYTLADRTNRYDEAMRYVSKALSIRPNDPAIIDSMGWVHYRLGNLEKALGFLTKAMELVEDGEVAAHYGELLWVMGRKEEAKAVWSRAMEQFSDNEVLQQTRQRFEQ